MKVPYKQVPMVMIKKIIYTINHNKLLWKAQEISSELR